MRIPVFTPEEAPERPKGLESTPAAQVEPSPPEPDYRDLYLRALADMANFRRRMQERAEEAVEAERARLLREFLLLGDDLERALAFQDQQGLREGLRATWEGFRRFLEREGIEEISSEGETFDPEIHEAVGVVEGEEGESGKVVQEVRKGYRYRGRLLRPARVIVRR
ncbi:MAG: nucleotide exchange factor GrpE [Chloroflexia bacterium]